MRMVGSVVFLPVKDLARTRAFYTQVIGLRLAMVQPAGAEIYDKIGRASCRERVLRLV